MLDKILGKHIAFITAHPDDESVLAGGTIILNTEKGGTNSLFCASLGEKGSSYITKSLLKSEVGKIRKKELFKVAKYLGIDTVKAYGFQDGNIKSYTKGLEEKIRDFLLENKPDIIVTFGEDGFTGHTDHIAVGELAKQVVRKNKIKSIILEFSKPPEDMCPELHDCLLKKRKNGTYGKIIQKHGNPTISVKVDHQKKFQALKMYKTQFEGINPYNIFPKRIALHLLSREYFKIVKK